MSSTVQYLLVGAAILGAGAFVALRLFRNLSRRGAPACCGGEAEPAKSRLTGEAPRSKAAGRDPGADERIRAEQQANLDKLAAEFKARSVEQSCSSCGDCSGCSGH